MPVLDQLVFALSALTNALPAPDKPKDAEKLFAPLYDLLAFPQGGESPARFRLNEKAYLWKDGKLEQDNTSQLVDEIKKVRAKIAP